MEMHQVRYFLAVSRILNFTRAAEECNVAQPSLTRAIKQLELELGGDLFRRERNFTHLTDFGQRMLPYLQQCFDSAASAKQVAQSLKTGTVQPLALVMSYAVDVSVIIDFLTQLTKTFRGLEITFLRGSVDEIREMLKKGEAEIALASSLGDDWDRLDRWPLFSEKMYLAINSGHALAAAPLVDSATLGREPMIGRTFCENTEDLRSLLSARDIALKFGHQTCSEPDLIAMLEAGLGISVLPESAPKSDKITRLSIADVDYGRTIFCYGVAGRQRSMAAASLIKMLRSADWPDKAA